MPYTQSQLRCLKAMGIVPWVEHSVVQSDDATTLRDAIVVAEAQPVTASQNADQGVMQGEKMDQTAEHQQDTLATQHESTPGVEPVDFMQTPLVEIPFRGKHCTQLGKDDAMLLILVEANSTQQNQYPFEPADARIFDDMLRAIAWRRQDVCLAVLPPSAAPSLFVDDNAPRVSDLCKPHRDAVLVFRQSVPDHTNPDELTVPLTRKGMLAWQLPHPALLRESPQRKRQAWNVLKAARARLS